MNAFTFLTETGKFNNSEIMKHAHILKAYRRISLSEALSEGASSCFDGEVSAVKFENGNLVITATGTPSLKSPKVLQENGVVGIEQWKE